MGESEEVGNEEEVRKLAEIRAYLNKHAVKLKEKLEHLQTLIEVIDDVLATKSFKRVEMPPTFIKPSKTTIPPQPVEAYRQSIPLKTRTGTLLAQMYIHDDFIRVVPTEDLVFSVDTPPFQAFLIARVLASMQKTDRERTNTGEIEPDKTISYKVETDGNVIKELVIRNYGNERRLRELKTSIRWTLEKMYEKTAKIGK